MGSAIFGGIIGFLAGVAFQFMRRAWSDLRKVKGSIPGLRRDAWMRLRRFAAWCVAIAVGLFVFGAWVASGVNHHPDTPRPASVTSPSPSRSHR